MNYLKSMAYDFLQGGFLAHLQKENMVVERKPAITLHKPACGVR